MSGSPGSCCCWAGTQPARSGTRPSPSSTTGGLRYGGSPSWYPGEGKLKHSFGVSKATPHPLQGIFLVYDISSERSYQHIVKWASDVDEVGVHEGRSGGSPAVWVGPYTVPLASTHPMVSRKSSSGTRRTRSTRGKCPKSKGWDPQASPVPPSMTRDPHPLAICTQAPQKQLPQCLGTLFPSMSAVVGHLQGSLFPTCKMFRDPLTSPCASSTVSCTPEEHSDLLGVPLGTS